MQETVRFQAQPEQQALVRDGRPALISTQKNSLVMIRPAKRSMQAGGRPVFVVAIHNLTKAPLNFSVHDIQVTQTVGDAAVPLKVYGYDDLVAEEQTRQVVSAVLVGAAAGVNEVVAARYGGYNTTNRTTASSTGVHTSTTTTYSTSRALAAQARAMRQNGKLIDAAVDQGQRNMAALERDVLKDDTLLPGEWYGGTLSLQPPAQPESDSGPKTYSIAMTVGPDRHVIDVVQSGPK
jgi:hypothetical protein